ncbi:putative Toluene tolerance transporter [Candidatus Terasakiella magnetica]|uniref:Putative Toluene tolerance transporter n=1 Tax=Candidatus Terasakiella magnetica TaxID=1867952 RepID=A0A1C3RKS1_9PROT|nr:ABC transporter substrate-binding protein [Candidatus Terasakiella magnetica]SCA57769.1 putative Toluene tolerance transporter [Candidatus Terasakiella magnetica]
MMTRRLFVAAFLSAFICLGATTASAKDFAKEAEGFIQIMADKAMNSFRTIDDEAALQKEFRTILNDGFDVRAIGKWVLGRYWRKAKPAEKEEYLKLFEDFIIVTYANRFKDYSGDDITMTVVQSLAKNDQDAIVRSRIDRPTSSEPIFVDWRVKSGKEGNMKVVDVLIAGVSMSQTQRSEFSSVIKRNGGKVNGLIDALKNKTAQLVQNVDQATN